MTSSQLVQFQKIGRVGMQNRTREKVEGTKCHRDVRYVKRITLM